MMKRGIVAFVCLLVAAVGVGAEPLAPPPAEVPPRPTEQEAPPAEVPPREVATQARRTSALYVTEDAITAKIRAELEKPAAFDFVETPLSEVVQYLKDLHKIQIELDGKALEEAGIANDCPITANMHEIRLRSALDLLLSQLNMTYVIADQVLLLTTVDAAATEYLSTRVYPIDDLVPHFDGKVNYSLLINVITSSVEPGSWDTGSISPYRGSLVIRQMEKAHQGIAELLEQLRAPEVVTAREATPELQPPAMAGRARRPMAVLAQPRASRTTAPEGKGPTPPADSEPNNAEADGAQSPPPGKQGAPPTNPFERPQ